MKAVEIDVTKLDKTAFRRGDKWIYASLILWPIKEGQKDRWGNPIGYVSQDIGKDRRRAGERGATIGTWKEIDTTPLKDMTAHNA